MKLKVTSVASKLIFTLHVGGRLMGVAILATSGFTHNICSLTPFWNKLNYSLLQISTMELLTDNFCFYEKRHTVRCLYKSKYNFHIFQQNINPLDM